ncbi:tetratricopeptide repeat protein [Thiohalomonas denitrificans]|uniref:tetratricopeptide repeat protein n=1 Tax=Thiohalomonas denitrificans TaxID=415747 RepID=UPI0026F108AD|nr:tetratricopeptide repeat protein [Thiohalomonas denitrificans]
MATSLSKPVLFGAFLFFALFAMTASGADPRSEFDKGTRAFQKKDYEEARAAFERARQAGLDTPALWYNLGVTEYQLGHYATAQRAFVRAAADPRWAQLASYNLGLVALQQKRPDAAAQQFRKAQTGSNTKLAALATTRLEQLSPAPKGETLATASLALGYDDNVIDPALLTPRQESDSFIELFGSLSHTTREKKQWRLDASAYLSDYQSIDAYDLGALLAGISRLKPIGAWRAEAGLFGEYSQLGGDPYLGRGRLQFQGRRSFEDLRLRLRYRFDQYTALDTAFNHLEGSRQQADVQGIWPAGKARLSIRYTLELNDRNDLATATTFTSYSPVRNTLRAGIDRPIGTDWRASAKVKFRNSHYDDTDVLLDSTRINREDDLTEAELHLQRALDKRWALYGTYIHSDNQSNIASYSYERNLFMAGVSGSF